MHLEVSCKWHTITAREDRFLEEPILLYTEYSKMESLQILKYFLL